jgi:hypothetical protein
VVQDQRHVLLRDALLAVLLQEADELLDEGRVAPVEGFGAR